LFPSVQAQVLPTETPEFREARKLADLFCVGCHLFPEPRLLDRATWKNHVQPLVRQRVGIDQFDPNGSTEERQTHAMWRAIWDDYILPAAPEKALPQAPRAPIQVGLKQFTVFDPKYRPRRGYATMVKIDAPARQIYVGNALTKTLDVMDAAGKPVSICKVDSTVVDLQQRPDGWLATQIGMVTPDDRPLGRLTRLSKTAGQFAKVSDVLTNLVRPTHCAVADLNQDGRDDLVVCSFGNRLGVSGQFAWYRNRGGTNYEENVLLDRPGATRSVVLDYNQDGRPDLIVLTAQHREGIFLLVNEGNGDFREVPLIQQPPVWGFAWFDLVDFNKDGSLDLITANGDLGDFPSCTKHYHGIRVYLNDGNFHFTETFFYPLNGAYKAVPADFDQDGDLDIAAISYFPDYARSPEESFVYLENKGGGRMEAFTFPRCDLGHWLVMDVGDVEGDGDLDLVLGSAVQTAFEAPEALRERWLNEGYTVLILKNNLRTNPPALQPRATSTR
jgi:hypothetical protein